MMCIILPCVVLFTSCGKDEPSNKPEAGGGTVKPPSNNHDFKYYFTAGGVKYDYYYGERNEFNTGADENSKRNVIVLSVAGFSEGFSTIYSVYNTREVACTFCIENFDYRSANPGTILHLVDSDMYKSFLRYKRIRNGKSERLERYDWGNGVPVGSVKFISFANGILTLEVNVTMNDGDPYNPTNITLYGTIHYRMGGWVYEY